ncbi:MAG: helix-turn-helix domain-containing protein [candidate division WOR-3 bacterium]
MERNITLKLKAIDDYQRIKNLKVVAARYGVHYSTLSRWLRSWKEDKFLHKRHWRRLSSDIEKRVVLLKENNPGVAIDQAKKLLSDEGINISQKAIYNTWHRYGLSRLSSDGSLAPSGPETIEIKNYLAYLNYLLKDKPNGQILRTCAKILNALPKIPDNYRDILEKIPDNLLSLRRKFDKLSHQFLKIPTPEFYKRIHKLRLKFEKKKFYYSAIRAGLWEIYALHLMRNSQKEIMLINHLKKLKGNLRDPFVNFKLTIYEATAWINLMVINKATPLAQKASQLLRRLPTASLYEDCGSLMTFMKDYRRALVFFQKALLMRNEKNKDDLYLRIATCLAIDARYREAIKYLNMVKTFTEKHYPLFFLNRAFVALGLGKIEESLLYFEKALERAKQEQFRNIVFTTVFSYGAICCLMGKSDEAIELLRCYEKLMKKYQLGWEARVVESLIESDDSPSVTNKFPLINLVHLIKKANKSQKVSDYRRLHNYAKKYGLRGFLQRCLFYFPELVKNILNKGKNPGLPRYLLQTPLFNSEPPIYFIKLLGHPVIYKNQKYLPIKLKPVESAFLFFMCFRISEPEKSVFLDEIYSNFWYKKKNPRDSFYHLLADIKNKLMIPGTRLQIQSGANGKILINKGFYITTDYSEFCAILSRAKALQRAGEWGFARKEYLRAFKLFRGEPFKKNFDNWSVDMRFRILSQLETEAISFAKSCLEHGNKNDARKILQKVLKIIPDSQEVKELLDGLMVG